MDSCARGAFLSGVGFVVSLNWLQAARVSNSAAAMKRFRVDRQGAYSVSMCIGRSYFWNQGETEDITRLLDDFLNPAIQPLGALSAL
jgi:hypothetical protein